jgi:hypothetical protein
MELTKRNSFKKINIDFGHFVQNISMVLLERKKVQWILELGILFFIDNTCI